MDSKIFFYLFIGSIFFIGFFLFKLIKQYSINSGIIKQTKATLIELEKNKNQIEQREKEKNLFLISLIHEIKIPISIIQNTLQLYFENLNVKKDKTLVAIMNDIGILNRDIINILDMEKINHLQPLYKHTSIFNISKAMKKEIDLFKTNSNNKKIALTLVSENALYIKIDFYAFDRIVHNLPDNAIKYTQPGGAIDISLTSDTSWIYLEIADNGNGISQSELDKIFKPYYRMKRVTHDKQGLGLGLFLVKTIIDSAGGKITVQSEINKGTTFTVVFPKYMHSQNKSVEDFTPQKSLSDPEIDLPGETYDVDKYSILIVEDNVKLLSFLSQILSTDYNVFCATNGKIALDKIIYIPKPDIIISDIIMEIMDGHEFFIKIVEQKRFNDIPFIFLTSKTTREEKLESLKKGAIDYIHKPFHIAEVKAKIQSILINRNITKEIEVKKIQDKIYSVIQKKGDERYTGKQIVFRYFRL